MRPDPIAALAEAWGREADAWLSPRMSEAQYIAMESRDTAIRHAAIAKRARKAAKRDEDARRTTEGRARYREPSKLGFRHTGWFTGWSIRLAQWDGAPYTDADWPRWRIRYRDRRALPGMGRPWHAKYKGRRKLWSLIREVGLGRFHALLRRGAL